KTTSLRMSAGFEAPDAGAIHLDGADIAHVSPHERPVNMMFQNYASFPHSTVKDNIAFGLKRAGLPKDEIAARVAEMVASVRLEGLEKRRPDQLSGGQRQRVASARASAIEPRSSSSDEPVAGMSPREREQTAESSARIARGKSVVVIEHDMDFVKRIAHKVTVSHQGRSSSEGSVAEVQADPRTSVFRIDKLNVSYGESHVIRDVSFEVAPGESVAIMGRNGMGKTTLLKASIGMSRSGSGSIRLDDAESSGSERYQRVRNGSAFSPQGRMS
ncbi:hypothetical protein OY671_008381, partial [Metschnikowia pulcherrima]